MHQGFSGKIRPCRDTEISSYGLISKTAELASKKPWSLANSSIINIASVCWVVGPGGTREKLQQHGPAEDKRKVVDHWPCMHKKGQVQPLAFQENRIRPQTNNRMHSLI